MTENNGTLLTYCPNYNKIINFEFLKSDYISETLVKFYKQYVCSFDKNNEEECSRVKHVDKIVNRYLDDYIFRKEMKNELLQIKVKKNADDILKTIIDNIIKIFRRYEEGCTRNIYISRWI